ncbi:MAG: heme NO-binding domain-containing protein [Pararhodobacter sp.]|nr:heme NO-binding domain-containing protein [Pararhodobacter sp.]
MHGLIGKAIQSFLSDSHGDLLWAEVALRSDLAHQLGPDGFEAMQLYDPALVEAVLDAATQLLGAPRGSLLEDLGTYLISNERLDPLRRLLRFGGVTFTDFLYSLDDLQGRTRLAVPELALPDLTITEDGPGHFLVICHQCPPGFGHVMLGILRAMADDYGALAVLEHCGSQQAGPSQSRRDDPALDELIAIELYDPAFHAGRRFELAVPEAS